MCVGVAAVVIVVVAGRCGIREILEGFDEVPAEVDDADEDVVSIDEEELIPRLMLMNVTTLKVVIKTS